MRKTLQLDLDFFLQKRQEIENEAANLAQAAGSDSEGLNPSVLPVTKYITADETRLLLDEGQAPLGENRAQELETKTDPGQDPGGWHFIGKLQRNKISIVAPRVDLIHSLDSQRLAESLDRWVEDHLNRRLGVLIQINIAGESQKSGLDPVEALEVIPDWIDRYPQLRFEGLMTMAPQIPAEECRPVFQSLRKLRDDLRHSMESSHAGDFRHLSMGMSADWQVAVSEGATLLRIGQSLYPPEGSD